MTQEQSKIRVGLYGGSFNPPHYGHFIAAFFAYHFLKLDEVWMMVTPSNPLKDPARYAPLEDRMDLCRMIAEAHPWLKPTDIEKDFASTQTADSLAELERRYPDIEFVWIMGADNLTNFHEWNRWQEIIDNHALAVLARPGDGDKALESVAAKYAAHLKVDNPEDLAGKNSGWTFIDSPGFDISSSQILQDLKAGKRNLRDLMPRVEQEILKRGLYGLTETAKPGFKPSSPF
ncbi:MAG: nicotinate (nicotinamide) nucleotide adenylyltransferase [Rhodospirillales bacterium]|nr:nicotinate (nicotinamide) nucleotide adenylyltransferase [Rhodospirillales bacterium]